MCGPFLSEPLDGPADLIRYSRRVRDLATIAPWRTLRATGTRYLRDPRLRMLLDRYATYSGSDPRRAPAALAVVRTVSGRAAGVSLDTGEHLDADVVVCNADATALYTELSLIHI